MTKTELHRRLRAKFAFTKDGFARRSKREVLVLVVQKRVYEVRALVDIPADESALFDACAVLDLAGGDELVHVTERGRYFDHVFYSDHEKLFTIGELRGEKRLSKMPFLKSRVAKSLRELEAAIQVVPWERIEDGVLVEAAPSRSKKNEKKKPVVIDMVHLENKKKKRYWQLLRVDGHAAVTGSGVLGSARRTFKTVPLDGALALEDAVAALLAEKRAEGFSVPRG